jgi:hypothetical protein
MGAYATSVSKIDSLMRFCGFLALLALTSCTAVREAKNTVSDLAVLDLQMSKAFGFLGFSLTAVNGGLLRIEATNSPWKSLPPAEKTAKAREIASFAYANYRCRDDLTHVTVIFAVHEDYLGLINVHDRSDGVAFARADLQAAVTPR